MYKSKVAVREAFGVSAPRSRAFIPPRWRRAARALIVAVAGLLAGGCTPPSSESGSQSASPGQAPPSQVPLPQQTTRQVLDAKQVLGQGGARPAAPRKIEPVTYALDAFLGLRGRAAKLQIDSLVRDFYAEHGRYPADYDEFKRAIIDANPSLQLPALPSYQAYSYDADKHELIVVEYPDKKGQ